MNTYPLPPAPGWSKDSERDGAQTHHGAVVGSAGDIQVRLGRTDFIGATDVEVGPVEVYVEDHPVTPAEARQLAALLVEAADLAGTAA
jgi:hypothetical protein